MKMLLSATRGMLVGDDWSESGFMMVPSARLGVCNGCPGADSPRSVREEVFIVLGIGESRLSDRSVEG